MVDHLESNQIDIMTEALYLNELKKQLANNSKTPIHKLLFKKTNAQLVRKINRIEKSIKRQNRMDQSN